MSETSEPVDNVKFDITKVFDIEKNKEYIVNNLLSNVEVNKDVVTSLSNDDLFKYAILTMKKMCENNVSLCTTDVSMMDTLNKLNLCIMSIAKTDNIHTISKMLDLTKTLYEKLLQKQSFFCLSQVTFVESFMKKVPTQTELEAMRKDTEI